MRRTTPVTRFWLALPLLGLAVVLAPRAAAAPAPADDEKKEETKKEKEEPATVAVEKGPFEVVLEASGAFEPKEAVEVSYRPLVYGGDLEVVEAAPSGATVAKGATLVRFKTDKIDEQVRAAETEVRLAKANVARLTEEGRRQEEGTAIALAKAEFEAKRSEEALRHFEQVERPLRVRESEYRLQGTKDGIQDQTEELEQLEKMYGADEVVEATEEIVIRRSRRGLERSKRWLGFQQQRHDAMVQIELPRDLTSLTLDRRRHANEWDRIQATAPLALETSRLELAKARANLEKQEASLAKLSKDLAAMTLLAPADGVAVAGSFEKGKWVGLEDLRKALRPGQKAAANATLFTVFPGDALRVRATTGEAGMYALRADQTGQVFATGHGDDAPVAGTVSEVARLSADANFEFRLDLASVPAGAMPGHTCKVKVVTSRRADALTVPSASVTKDGDKTLVHVRAAGETKPREVKAGATSGGRTEIVSGVAAGERVLESPPKPK
jgi:hypothetical protein